MSHITNRTGRSPPSFPTQSGGGYACTHTPGEGVAAAKVAAAPSPFLGTEQRQHAMDRTRTTAILRAVRSHCWLTAAWGISVVLVTSSVTEDTAYAGRLGLLLGLVALLGSGVEVARWIVQRLTQIIALWEEDVRVPLRPPLHLIDRREA